MNESLKTTAFAASAGVMLLLAAMAWWLTQPRQIKEFESVGQPFFSDFESSSDASALEVAAVDAETAKLKSFRVEEKDGVWTIPSHYGYPAEAADRLAQCSSSLIGLTRESLVGRTESDHERFGVIDPMDEELLDPDAAGKRITLKDSSGNVLADLIIGNRAEERDATDREIAFGQAEQRPEYYVRHPDEDQTYKVGLELELSTRFSDWIRPDLLELEASDLRRILVDNYELEEQADPLGRLTQLFKKQGDQLLLNREDGFGEWNLEGLDETTEELDNSKINTAVATLADLQIVGVRKKTGYMGQQLLTPDLKLNRIPELEANPTLFRQTMATLQSELSDYGFNLAPGGQDQDAQDLILVSTFGELKAGTEQGVVYTLQFGNPIEGDQNEIEIGGTPADSSGDKEEKANEPLSDGGDKAPQDEADGEGNGGEKEAVDGEQGANEEMKNRFLMIRVEFDESLLGEKPVPPKEPVEPVKPEGYTPAADDEEQAGETDEAPQPPGGQDEGQTQDADDRSEETPPADGRPEAFQQYDAAKAQYDKEKTEYELERTQFEDEQKEFDEKVKEGKQLEAELNERFGAWFYVISAENLESLQMRRVDLVKPKQDEAKIEVPGQEETEDSLPERPNIDLGDETSDGDGE